MSKLASLTLLFFTAISLVANHASSQPLIKPTFESTSCYLNLGQYSADSPYETNLGSVLTTLQQQANSTTSVKFYNTSSGTNPDTAYGQYYCRGDISTDLCGACIQEAAKGALNFCGLTKGAIVMKGECTLRYSNQSMYGILDVDRPVHTNFRGGGNVSDPQMFSVVLTNTMNGLIQEAVKGNRRTGLFATGEGKVSTNETLYSLVQCSPDLDGTQCDTCLRSIYNDMSTCCGQWPATFFSLYPSCLMMYSTEGAFYFSTPAAAPLPLTSSPPAPSQTPPPSTSAATSSLLTVSQPPPPPIGGSAVVGSSESMKLRIDWIVITALVILMLVFYP